MLPIWIILIIYTGSYLSIFSRYGQPGGVQSTDVISNLPLVFGGLGLIFFFTLISNAISVGADRAIVLEGNSVVDAIRRGGRLLIDRFGDYFVIGILMFIVAIAISILIGCSIVSVMMLLNVGGTDFTMIADSMQTFESNPFTNIPFFIFSVILSLLIQTVTRILFSSTWTLAFRYWQGKDPIVPQNQPEITAVE